MNGYTLGFPQQIQKIKPHESRFISRGQLKRFIAEFGHTFNQTSSYIYFSFKFVHASIHDSQTLQSTPTLLNTIFNMIMLVYTKRSVPWTFSYINVLASRFYTIIAFHVPAIVIFFEQLLTRSNKFSFSTVTRITICLKHLTRSSCINNRKNKWSWFNGRFFLNDFVEFLGESR